MRTLAQLGQEALILDWQRELDLFGDKHVPPTSLIAWADDWILALDTPPTALLGLSVDTRTVNDTRPYLQELAAGTSWSEIVPIFAAKTLIALEESYKGSRMCMHSFYEIALDKRFDPIFQADFVEAWKKYTKTLENDGEGWSYWDREYFYPLLEHWINKE